MSETFKVPRKITPDDFYRGFLCDFVDQHLSNHPSFQKVDLRATISLTDETDGNKAEGGRWHLRLKDGKLSVIDTDPFPAEVFVEQSVTHWREGILESNGTPIEDIKKRMRGIAKTVSAFVQLNGSFCIQITREEEEPWEILVRTGTDVQKPGPFTIISLPDYDYEDIRNGASDPVKLLMLGKIKVKGNSQLARQFVSLSENIKK